MKATTSGTARDRARDVMRRAAVPLRRRYYADQRYGRAVARLPERARLALGLDDVTAVGSRKIEIGPGGYPRPGYLHVDVWPWGQHAEAIAPMWALPFPDGWAEEIIAVQALEHAPPDQLVGSLLEWRRVLRPGGSILVSVPNGPAIMDALRSAPVPEKWPLMGSILGMYCAPSIRRPEELTMPSDHQIVFDLELLTWAVREAGFVEVRDVGDEYADRHTEAWASMVPEYSLTIAARSEPV